jgi:hypothetical protein
MKIRKLIGKARARARRAVKYPVPSGKRKPVPANQELQKILALMTNHQNHCWRRDGSPLNPVRARTYLTERQLERLDQCTQ